MSAQLWVIAGPNGAGKTTLVTRRVARRIPIVNPDDIAFSMLRLRDGGLDQAAAGRAALTRRRAHLAANESFAIETTLTGHGSLKLMRDAKQRGYKVTLVFVGLSEVALSMARVADRIRSGGHAIPYEDLVRRFPQAMGNLPDALSLADRAYVLDNSGTDRGLLLIQENGIGRYVSSTMPAWLEAAISGSPTREGDMQAAWAMMNLRDRGR